MLPKMFCFALITIVFVLGSASAFCTRPMLEFTQMDYTWSTQDGQPRLDKHMTDVFYDATNKRVAMKFDDTQAAETTKVWLIRDFDNKTECRVDTTDKQTTCTCSVLRDPFICIHVPDHGWNYTLIGSLLGLVIGGPYVFEYNYLVDSSAGVVENTFRGWTGYQTPVFQQVYTSGLSTPLTRTTFYQNIATQIDDPSVFVPPTECYHFK